jgi:mono/diheme cytochrome c family protein
MAYYIGYGGAIMPAYGEALSVTERWDVVNYLRTLAQK